MTLSVVFATLSVLRRSHGLRTVHGNRAQRRVITMLHQVGRQHLNHTVTRLGRTLFTRTAQWTATPVGEYRPPPSSTSTDQCDYKIYFSCSSISTKYDRTTLQPLATTSTSSRFNHIPNPICPLKLKITRVPRRVRLSQFAADFRRPRKGQACHKGHTSERAAEEGHQRIRAR